MNTNKIKTRKALGYVRVSTKKQKQNGVSLAVQAATIKKYVNEYNEKNPSNPLELLEILDDANSAFKLVNHSNSDILLTNRPGMQDVLNRIRSNGITDIVLYCRDRLNRNVHEYVAFSAMFKKLGVSLHYTSSYEIINSDISAINAFYESMMANIAMFNAQNITYNCKNALLQVVRDGYFAGGRVPFGYTLKKNTNGKSYLAIDKEESSIVQEIFRLYSIGYSYRDILEKIKPYTCNFNTQFNSPNVIEQIINNDIYTGTYSWNKVSKFVIEFNNDVVKAPSLFGSLQIISKKDYDYVHKLKDIVNSKSSRFFSTSFLLTGLVTCNNCGGFLKGKVNGKGKSSVYYCKCNTDKWVISINKNDLEELVLSKLKISFNNLLVNDSFMNKCYANFLEKFNTNMRLKNETLIKHKKIMAKLQNEINISNEILAKMDILQSEDPIIYSSDFFDAIKSSSTILILNNEEHKKIIKDIEKDLQTKVPTLEEFKASFDELKVSIGKINSSSTIDKYTIRFYRILLTQIIDKIILTSTESCIKLSINLVIPNLNTNLNLLDTCPISR